MISEDIKHSAIFGGALPAPRDIVVYPRNQSLRQMSYTLWNIHHMMNAILFPSGKPGWDENNAHVREHATAFSFLTFTRNQKWSKIVTNLLPSQSASD